MNPQFPVYIVSKGRWESRLTARALEEMSVPYRIVVEEQEYTDYCNVIDKRKVLVLDKKYQRDYDTFDMLGDSKSRGPGPARNFVWDHSIAQGAPWHWVMDDNLQHFARFSRNLKVRVDDGTIFRAMEDFVLRYLNIAMAGPCYRGFVNQAGNQPCLIFNTRIYSCGLIRNDTGFRWRGRYNEDTDLSLRMLKAGWCTVEFVSFLANKITTQVMKGGNTKEFYEKEGTLAKSLMQVAMHPDVSCLTRRSGRIHHRVDYRPFRRNKLILRPGIEILQNIDDYGMKLRQSEEDDDGDGVAT